MHDLDSILSGLFEALGIGIRITDTEGEIVWVNQEYCVLYGYKREELIGRHFTLVLPPEKRAEAAGLYRKQIQEEKKDLSPVHWRVHRKDNSPFTVAVSSFNLKLEDGKLYRVAKVRDVSDIIKDQNQLEFQASILECVKDSVVVVSTKREVLYWNYGASRLYGWQEEELKGNDLKKYLPVYNGDDLLEYFKKGHSKLDFFDWRFLRSDGEEIYIDLRVSPLFEQDSIIGFIFLGKNVTEKFKNKAQIREQRNMLASLIESQSNFLIRLDARGHYTFLNNAFLAFGNFDENIIGKPFKNHIHPIELKGWQEKFPLWLQKSGIVHKLELRMVNDRGLSLWTRWEFVAIKGQDGQVVELQGVGIDISEVKKIERERERLLQQSQILNEELRANEEELRQNLENTVELNEYIHRNERKLKSMLENSFDAIMLYNVKGYITYASPSVESTIGYTPAELMGKKGITLTHEEDKPHLKRMLKKMMEKAGNRVYILKRAFRKDGKCIWVETYMTNLLHDPDVRGIVSNFRDVTERIEAEERIRNSESTLNMAQHIARLGSAEFDLVTGMVRQSSGMFAIYDFDLDNFSEDDFLAYEYVHPEDVDRLKNRYPVNEEFGPAWVQGIANLPEEKLKHIEQSTFEYRIISAAGKLKYIKSNARFIWGEERPVKLILTIQDVSEGRHLERLLDETSQIARIGSWELDIINDKIFWTDQTYRLFEISPVENLTVNKVISFYHPDYQPVLRKAVHNLGTEGHAFDLELKMTTAAKKEIWVRMIGQGEKVNGKVVMAKGTMQDISDKKEAEREVREYGERLRLATEAAGIGIWEWDLQQDKFVWDQQMRALYEIPENQEEISFADYQKSVHPEDQLRMEEKMQDLLKSGRSEWEFRILSSSLEVKWIKSYGKVWYSEDEQLKRVIGLNWDISPLKKTQEILRKNNEELVKINEELDHFVYSTSHNLRAPLTSILGIVNLIRNYSNPDEYLTYIDLIESSVRKLDETIQEINNYSKNTRTEVTPESVCFEELIQNVIESLSFLENAGKINISYIIPAGFVFISDSSRLKMILNNILSNAIKYYNPIQEDPFIHVVLRPEKEGVSIKIKDNGLGIAKEYHEKIFNMFFRASTKSSGSGLGLYIVKEAVLKLSGKIQLESVPGEGSEFRIFLPREA